MAEGQTAAGDSRYSCLQESLRAVERELIVLTDKLQQNVREDLRLFLQGWAPKGGTVDQRHTDQGTIFGSTDSARNAFMEEVVHDCEHEWMHRPLRGYLATELHKPVELSVIGTPKAQPWSLSPSRAKPSTISESSREVEVLKIGTRNSRRRSREERHSRLSKGSVKSVTSEVLDKAVTEVSIRERERVTSLPPGTMSSESLTAPSGIKRSSRVSIEADESPCKTDSEKNATSDNLTVSKLSSIAKPLFRDRRRVSTRMTLVNMSRISLGSDRDAHSFLGMLTLLRTKAAEIVVAQSFDILVGCLIVLNAFWIGLQTEMSLKAALSRENEPMYLNIVSTVFCFIFLVELVLRMFVYGCPFFYAEGWTWNIFDFVIVALQVVEEFLGILGQTNGGWSYGSSWMRVLRGLRLIRIVRLVRILRLLRELRTMVGSILCTFRSFFWTMILLLVVTYAASVYVTQMVADHAADKPGHVAPGTKLHDFYGSMGNSILSFYQTISGGLEWRELSQPLHENIGPWTTVAFCFFVAFTTFSLLNVVTGIFVESALENSKSEADLNMVNRLWEVFTVISLPEDGRISYEDFERYCNSSQMKAYFKSVDVDVSEAENLFQLLDVEDQGSIAAEDFVMGCLRLRGSAKAIDLATLMSETRRYHRRFQSQIIKLHDAIHRLEICGTKAQGHTLRAGAFASEGAPQPNTAGVVTKFTHKQEPTLAKSPQAPQDTNPSSTVLRPSNIPRAAPPELRLDTMIEDVPWLVEEAEEV